MTFLSSFSSFFGRFAAALALTALTAGSVVGCNFDGGLNDNIKAVGDEPGGVKLAVGDIAVAPSGKYVVFKRETGLAMAIVASGATFDLPVDSPARLAFASGRDVIYVTSTAGLVKAIDIDARQQLWSRDAEFKGDLQVVASGDDERVVVGAGEHVAILAADDGTILAEEILFNDLVDLEILPDDQRVLAVERHTWNDEQPATPTTTVHVLELSGAPSRAFNVPNCSDNIVVPNHGENAFLAPSECSENPGMHFDPISYIDLEPGSEQHVRNLPGFGPVALAPDGVTAVGFLDTANMDETLFDDPSDIPSSLPRFHLMVIDTESLDYDFYAYGLNAPRYAMTPDGQMLLVDGGWGASGKLFDIESREYRDIAGPAVGYEQLTFSGDSQHAYVLSGGKDQQNGSDTFRDYNLFDLNIAAAEVSLLPADFRPRNVNISPTDNTLFLRKDKTSICIYSLQSKSCERELTLAIEK